MYPQGMGQSLSAGSGNKEPQRKETLHPLWPQVAHTEGPLPSLVHWSPSTLPPMNTAEHPSYPAQGTGQSSQVLEDFPRLTRKTK